MKNNGKILNDDSQASSLNEVFGRGKNLSNTKIVESETVNSDNSDIQPNSTDTSNQGKEKHNSTKHSTKSQTSMAGDNKTTIKNNTTNGETKTETDLTESVDKIKKTAKTEQNAENLEQKTAKNNQSVENAEQNFENEEQNSENQVMLPEEIVNEKIKSALETQTPKKRKKSFIIKICMLAFNLLFMIFIINSLMKGIGEDQSIIKTIETQGDKLWWLLGCVVAYIVFFLAQVMAYKTLLKNLTGKSRWGISYDVAVLGKYYDTVTPFSVGGQPMQIVRLANSGLGAGVSTSIPLIKVIIMNVVNAFLAVIFFIFGLPKVPQYSPLIKFLFILLVIVGVIGLIFTVFVAIFMFLISNGSILTRSFVSGVLRFLYKIKLVKNYRQTYRKVMNQVSEYKFSMKYLKRNKGILFKLIIYSIIECLSYAVMAYFVALAFSSLTSEIVPSEFLLIALSEFYLCQMASCYIPLPGGTGLMELSFILLFGNVVGNNIVWALLIFRFFTYYLIIVHGFIHEVGRITRLLIKEKIASKRAQKSLSNKVSTK